MVLTPMLTGRIAFGSAGHYNVRATLCEEVVPLKLSARNVLKGKVKSVNHGAVNSEVVVELPNGQQIVSVITKSSAEGLGLVEGKEVYAVVKATNVILGID